MCVPRIERAGGDSVIGRATAVLDAFGPDDGQLSISELARRSGLPKATVHRLVTEMSSHRWLERTPSGGARLGLRLFELGQLATRSRGLREAALPFMEDLREATRQTIHLAVLEGTDVVYLEIFRGRDGTPYPSRVGGRVPAHATGIGKAILAYASPEVVASVIEAGLVPVGPRAIVMPGMLRAELRGIARTGIAFDREESAAGAGCVASPVIGGDGQVVGGLSVSGWTNRMNLDRMAAAVRTSALAVSRVLRTRIG